MKLFRNFLLAIFIGTDTLIFFKSVFANLVLGIVGQIVLLILVIVSFGVSSFGRRNLFLFMIFFLTTFIIRFLSVGVDYPDVYLYLFRILTIYVVYLALSQKELNFVQILNLAIFLNILPALIPFLGNRVALNVNYSGNLYSLGEVGVRYTGFFSSPGYLMFFLASYFAIIFISKEFKNIMVILALIEGYLTFNRSFLILLLFVSLYLLISKKGKLVIFFTLSGLMFPFWFPYIENYINNAILRFAADSILESERLYGSTGFISALESSHGKWLFGNPVSYDGGLPQFQGGDGLYNVHFGIIQFMLLHGLFFLIPIIFMWYRMLSRELSKEFILGILVMLIFVSIEPLFDTILFWLVPFYVYQLKKKTNIAAIDHGFGAARGLSHTL